MTHILLAAALVLHNLEEALRLPAWARQVRRSGRAPQDGEFAFAVSMITLLMIAIIAADAAFPENRLKEAAFRGLAGAMMINALTPHAVASIRYGSYCPGTATGLLLVWPAGFLVLREAIAADNARRGALALSIAGMGIVLPALLPILFRLGRFVMGRKGLDCE